MRVYDNKNLDILVNEMNLMRAKKALLIPVARKLAREYEGKKIKNVDGRWSKIGSTLYDKFNSSNEDGWQIYLCTRHDFLTLCIKRIYQTPSHIEGDYHSNYYEQEVYLGRIEDGFITNLDKYEALEINDLDFVSDAEVYRSLKIEREELKKKLEAIESKMSKHICL